MGTRTVSAGHIDGVLERLAGEEGRQDPYPFYALLRQHPPVYDDHHKAYLVSRYADCRKALTSKTFGRPDAEFFDRRVPDWRAHPSLVCGSRTMQFGDERSHPRRRGSVSDFFTPRTVRELVEIEAEVVDRLLDDLAEVLERHGEADLQEALSFRLPNVSIATMFGVPESEVSQFRPLTLAVANALEPGLTPRQLAAADDAYEDLRSYFDKVIAARRRSPRDDLSTHIVRCHDAEPATLAADELVPMFVALYAAGTFNTSSFIGNGAAALLANPDEADRLRADPSLGEAAVTEILRYETPMHITRRLVLENTELGGTPLRKGAHLAVLIGSANRDPEMFDNPDTFRIGRTGPAPLSFGGGTFYCIGAALGKLEGDLVFRRLITRFPTLRLCAEPTHNRRAVLRGYLRIPVTARPPASSGES